MRVSAVMVATTLVTMSVQPRAQQRSGPWDPQTEAAAEAAVLRLGSNVSIGIPGLLPNASPTSVIATVAQVQQALHDIGATETARVVQVDLPGDVLFDFDKAVIRPQAVPVLERVATVLSIYPGSQVLIEGYTDAKGTASKNQALSEQRALAVRAWLEGRGLKGLRITTQGLGASSPVASNTNPDGSDNPEGRRKNRRVRIVITKPS
jgi:outer membrane protein OmpA-like peptidoglycan-associated protein